MSDLISRKAAIEALSTPHGILYPIRTIEELPSVQTEHLVKESGNLVKGLVNDCISRQAAIDAAIEAVDEWDGGYNLTRAGMIADAINNNVPSVQPQRWIPFETREPDAEEKEDHPEWEYVLCGNLPDDGQRILVNIKYKGHEAVQMDEYVDDGGYCYLDSGYDIGTEATAWMPLPEPWRGKE